MEIRPKLYFSSYKDPFINLSLENQLLLNIKSNERILFLYNNSDSVVLGRFQNPWLECNLKRIQDKNINLVRRQSGGGCVYHDPGNLNFSFIYPEKDFNKDLNNSLLIDSLKLFSIDAFASGRSDLLVDINGHKKFSGSAFKQKKDRSFHHGTLLIDSNLSELKSFLIPRLENCLESKSIKSNPAVVENLSNINNKLTQESLIDSLTSTMETYYQKEIQLELINSFVPCQYYHHLTSWDWRWGETPLFKTQFGAYEISIKKGTFITINDDEIQQRLVGLKLLKENLEQARHSCEHFPTLRVIDYLLTLVID